MIDYVITQKTRQQVGRELFFKGDIRTITINYAPWADDNGNVTSVTWTVESGQASITANTLSDNTATVTLSTTEAGNSMIKAIATNGTNQTAFYIRARAKDPRAITEDYGMRVDG
jgi:hypothetical protein